MRIDRWSQYYAVGILESWIIDPQQQTILVLQLEGDYYTEVGMFRDEQAISSPTLKELTLRP